MARGRQTKNAATIKVAVSNGKGEQHDEEFKVQWSYKTEPKEWQLGSLLAILNQGLPAATRRYIKGEILRIYPGVKLYENAKPMIEMFMAAGQQEAVNAFLALQQASGQPMIESVPLEWEITEQALAGSAYVALAEEDEEGEDEETESDE